jgi:hypothetical protein
MREVDGRSQAPTQWKSNPRAGSPDSVKAQIPLKIQVWNHCILRNQRRTSELRGEIFFGNYVVSEHLKSGTPKCDTSSKA